MQRANLLFVSILAIVGCAETTDEGLSNAATGGKGSGGTAGTGGSGGNASGSGGGGVGGTSAAGGTAPTGGNGGSDAGSGGSSAAGGIGGVGGIAGAGGSGGAAGAGTGGVAVGGAGGGVGGSGGSGTGGTGGAPATGFVVQYKVEISGTSGSAIGSQLWVVNNGSNTVNLNELTVRYYFTNEVTAELIHTINWANVGTTGGATTGLGSGEITITTLPLSTPAPSADSYVEFGFNTGGRVLPPGQRVQFSWTVQNYASQSFVQTGDHSFNAALTSQADWANVVLLQGQSVLWGSPP